MTQPSTTQTVAMGVAVATAQKQLSALSAAIALVSTNYVTAGASTTEDLAGSFVANVNAMSNVLTYYQNYFAVLNGNATS